MHTFKLDATLTLEELKDALDSMPKSKFLSLDGIPPELLSELWHVVGPILLHSINVSVKVGSFHRDFKKCAHLFFSKETRTQWSAPIIDFEL